MKLIAKKNKPRTTRGFNSVFVLTAALALVLFAPSVGATLICKWVDDKGRTQVSNLVPDKFKEAAICTPSRRYELSPEQQQEARQREQQQRKAAEQAKARSDQASNAPAQATSSAPGTEGAIAALPKPDNKQPAETPTDCETAWRIYGESIQCFLPYRTATGGIKAEAFANCQQVVSPVAKCGYLRK